jgi:hypothetical protein
LAVAGTTLWLCSMPRRQKMPAFAGMTDYSSRRPNSVCAHNGA